MPSIIQIVGLASGRIIGIENQYVKSYTPDGNDGCGDLVVTRDITQAKVYSDQQAALEAWRATSNTHPIRYDGEPNRPMTAFTVTIIKIKER